MAIRVTLEQWKTCIVLAGLTGRDSAELEAIGTALGEYHKPPTSTRKGRVVKAAYERWRAGNHAGEMSLLAGTDEYKKLVADLDAIKGPPPVPPRPARPGPVIPDSRSPLGSIV